MRFSDVPITQQQSWASASHFYFLRTSWMQEEQRADLRENSPLRTVGGLSSCFSTEAGKDWIWQFCFDKNLKV